jgi:hypothetical protein
MDDPVQKFLITKVQAGPPPNTDSWTAIGGGIFSKLIFRKTDSQGLSCAAAVALDLSLYEKIASI